MMLCAPAWVRNRAAFSREPQVMSGKWRVSQACSLAVLRIKNAAIDSSPSFYLGQNRGSEPGGVGSPVSTELDQAEAGSQDAAALEPAPSES